MVPPLEPREAARRAGRRAGSPARRGRWTLAALLLGSLAAFAPGASANHPGPDAEGYVMLGVGSNFIDIAATGGDVAFGDDTSTPLTMPFTVDFYDRTGLNVVNVGSNGVLGFTAPVTTGTPSNLQAAGPSYVAAPFWTDFDGACLTSEASLKQEVRPADLPYRGRIQIIQWTGFGVYQNGACSSPTSTFQVQLFEGSDILEFYYMGAPNNCDESSILLGLCWDGAVGVRGMAAGITRSYEDACNGGHNSLNCNPEFQPSRYWKNGPDGTVSTRDANDQSIDLYFDETVTFDLDASDDPRSFRLVEGLAAGTGTLTGLPADTTLAKPLHYLPFGQLTYAPPGGDWTGTASFTYEVNDGRDGTQEATVTFNVLPRIGPVSVNVVEDAVTGGVGNPIRVTAVVSGGLQPYECAWTTGGLPIIGAPTSCVETTFTYDQPGYDTVRLTVEDAIGQTAYDEAFLTIEELECGDDCPVEPCETCPIADFRYRIDAVDGFRVTFEDRSVDPDGDLSDWAWDFGDGATSFAREPEHTYAGYGTYLVTLHVVDAADNIGRAQRLISFLPEPTYSGSAPVADPGPQQATGYEGELMTLGPSEPSAGVSYRWTQTGGPPVSLSDPTSPNPTFVAPPVATGATEELTFQLVVYDGRTQSIPITVTVTVLDGNGRPTAVAGVDLRVDEGTRVTLNGTRSFDPDREALRFEWTQASGPSVALDDAASPTPSFTAPDAPDSGPVDVVFLLTVHDGSFASAPDSIRVRVLPIVVPEPPAIQATPAGLARVAFQLMGLDADGPVDYAWEFGDGETSAEPAPTHRFPATGDYVVNVTVTAADGTSETYQRVVHVTVPTPPETGDGGTAGDAQAPGVPLVATLLAVAALAAARRRGGRGGPALKL